MKYTLAIAALIGATSADCSAAFKSCVQYDDDKCATATATNAVAPATLAASVNALLAHFATCQDTEVKSTVDATKELFGTVVCAETNKVMTATMTQFASLPTATLGTAAGEACDPAAKATGAEAT